jgi:predicted GNAT family N-acyltransferase
MIRIELMAWDQARAHARPIRLAVFVEEQRVPVEIEWDDQDETSLHALAYSEEGNAIATGRLLPDGHIGRMAVLK